MIQAVPPSHRARALSALGASHRVGLLVGPLVGAGLIAWQGLRRGLPARRHHVGDRRAARAPIPDLGADERRAQAAAGHASAASVLLGHRRTSCAGVAVDRHRASRSIRNTLLPLWADHIGMSASQTSLVFALAGAVAILFFLPGGWLIDHRGRAVVAVPVVLTVAVGALVLPLASTGPPWWRSPC